MLKRSPCQLALIGLFTAAAPAAMAAPLTFNDSYTLSTTNQSMWAPGAQARWSYDSGFLGGAWGTYAGNAPVGRNISAITGSEREMITPRIPGIPSSHVPSTRTCTSSPWGDVCTPELGNYDIPGTPDIPATYADTRTGAALGISSSGRVGVEVKAQANGGAIGVVVPVQTALQIADTGKGIFHVGATNVIAGASITSTAPSFKAGVDGVINLDNAFSATGCVIGAGCSNTDATVNLNPGQFSLVGLDTTQAKPFSAFGLGIPQVKYDKEIVVRAGAESAECSSSKASPGQSALIENGVVSDPCATGPFAQPAIGVLKVSKLKDNTASNLSGTTLSLKSDQAVLRVTADLTGIAQYALGASVDILNPELSLKVATVSGSIIDVQAGVSLGMSQRFDFTPTLVATLEFDRDVEQWRNVVVGSTDEEVFDPSCFFNWEGGCNGGFFRTVQKPVYAMRPVNVGRVLTVDLNAGTDFEFADGSNGNLLSRTYSVKDANNFSTRTGITIDPTLPIRAGCFQASITLGPSTDLDCLFDEEYKTTGLLDFSVYSNTFSLGGFNSSVFRTPVGGTPDLPVDPRGPSIPEPASLLLMLLGMGALAYVHRRQPVRPAAAPA